VQLEVIEETKKKGEGRGRETVAHKGHPPGKKNNIIFGEGRRLGLAEEGGIFFGLDRNRLGGRNASLAKAPNFETVPPPTFNSTQRRKGRTNRQKKMRAQQGKNNGGRPKVAATSGVPPRKNRAGGSTKGVANPSLDRIRT